MVRKRTMDKGRREIMRAFFTLLCLSFGNLIAGLCIVHLCGAIYGWLYLGILLIYIGNKELKHP